MKRYKKLYEGAEYTSEDYPLPPHCNSIDTIYTDISVLSHYRQLAVFGLFSEYILRHLFPEEKARKLC